MGYACEKPRVYGVRPCGLVRFHVWLGRDRYKLLAMSDVDSRVMAVFACWQIGVEPIYSLIKRKWTIAA